MKAVLQFILRRMGYILLFLGVLGTVATIIIRGGGMGYGIALMAAGILLNFLGRIWAPRL